ncbi:Uncharacterized protein Rs2_15765 [Raphanus sativus]|nr:Uncharacterized protein Rs2_15765 [Raphanus sativus]
MLPIYHSPCIYSGEASWSHHKKLAKHLTTEEDLAPAMVSSSMLFLLSFAVHACHNLTGASGVLYIGPPAELLTSQMQRRSLYSSTIHHRRFSLAGSMVVFSIAPLYLLVHRHIRRVNRGSCTPVRASLVEKVQSLNK